PRPVPVVSCFNAFVARKNLVNSLCCALAGMPMPLSLTVNVTVRGVERICTATVPPESVYLIALPTRFASTSFTMKLSVYRFIGCCGWLSLSVIPRSSALKRCWLIISAASRRASWSALVISMLPLSIRAMLSSVLMSSFIVFVALMMVSSAVACSTATSPIYPSMSMCAYVLIAESGVRNWWEATEMNSLFMRSISFSMVISLNTWMAPTGRPLRIIDETVRLTGTCLPCLVTYRTFSVTGLPVRNIFTMGRSMRGMVLPSTRMIGTTRGNHWPKASSARRPNIFSAVGLTRVIRPNSSVAIAPSPMLRKIASDSACTSATVAGGISIVCRNEAWCFADIRLRRAIAVFGGLVQEFTQLVDILFNDFTILRKEGYGHLNPVDEL